LRHTPNYWVGKSYTATQEIALTNQNPKDEWWREAPPLVFWVTKLTLYK